MLAAEVRMGVWGWLISPSRGEDEGSGLGRASGVPVLGVSGGCVVSNGPVQAAL